MKKVITQILKLKWIVLTVALVGVGAYFFVVENEEGSATISSFSVVETVDVGEVSSGIETTGEIIAAQKLDLDVYKQLSRIEAVNVVNGGHVEEGDVLISFDKSDAYSDIQSSQVSVVEAELSLQEKQENYSDPNTTLSKLQNDIQELETAIKQAELDKSQAYRDYLNADIEAESANTKTEAKTAPTVSGLYTADTEGEYHIKVYGSGASSGFSYIVSGLPGSTESVIFDMYTQLGNNGLEIKFSSTADVKSGDEWVVAVPNVYAPEYIENKEIYEEAIVDLDEAIAGYQLDISTKQQQIEDILLTDGTDYRDLNVAQAEAVLSEAQVKLAQNYDVLQERNIVAPFSGTVQDMQNVVVGATPVGGQSDPIFLGTLISDTFLTTFTLSATDVAKVELGQRVKVTVTSFAEQPVFEATISEISSLPSSSGVAQYEVLAELEYNSSDSDLVLREGMLADIEIVEEDNPEALRIPISAFTYEQGVPMVQVIDELTPEQEQQISRLGIVKAGEADLPTYPVEIELGIIGKYYVEVLSGLEEGMRILTTSVSNETGPVVEQANVRGGGAAGFTGGAGGAGGGGRGGN